MNRMKMLLSVVAMFFAVAVSQSSYAGMPARHAVKRDVTTTVTKDLATPLRRNAALESRTCLDGRPVSDVPVEHVVEYWVSMECVYCGIREPLKAQQTNPDGLCIVARHMPSSPSGMKKALAYEALKKFSPDAANRFWDDVIPKAGLPMPQPYEGAMIRAYTEIGISQEAFAETLQNEAVDAVNKDVAAGRGVIRSTPTYVIQGIRWGSCDFTAEQLEKALRLSRQARAGDSKARNEIIEAITRGRMNEQML